MVYCRSCGIGLHHELIDLGYTPLANSFQAEDELEQVTAFCPLRVLVCPDCLLAQLAYGAPVSVFDRYAYFSSVSQRWLDHCRDYAIWAIQEFDLTSRSLVVEVGSNDGSLLQYFKQQGIKVLGVDPAANLVEAATLKGIRTEIAYFGAQVAEKLAREVGRADLIIANNVLAHAPDLADFIGGIKKLLKPDGYATFEFPHLQCLMEQGQFDTIYHEHVYYFSLLSVSRVFDKYGLDIFDAIELPTHGGSLRVTATHLDRTLVRKEAFHRIMKSERAARLDQFDGYTSFAEKVTKIKCELLQFLTAQWQLGLTVVGYGAPAKATTLLNYCGIGPELVQYLVDATPYKQGRYVPGARIPIYPPERIYDTKPDFLLVMPWNHWDEITGKLFDTRKWGCRFVRAIPYLLTF